MPVPVERVVEVKVPVEHVREERYEVPVPHEVVKQVDVVHERVNKVVVDRPYEVKHFEKVQQAVPVPVVHSVKQPVAVPVEVHGVKGGSYLEQGPIAQEHIPFGARINGYKSKA